MPLSSGAICSFRNSLERWCTFGSMLRSLQSFLPASKTCMALYHFGVSVALCCNFARRMAFSSARSFRASSLRTAMRAARSAIAQINPLNLGAGGSLFDCGSNARGTPGAAAGLVAASRRACRWAAAVAAAAASRSETRGLGGAGAGGGPGWPGGAAGARLSFCKSSHKALPRSSQVPS